MIWGKLHLSLAALVLCTSTVAIAAQGTDKPLYKWTDDKGVIHYGDSIPPQYASKERRVLNRQAVEVGLLEGEKTDAERAAEATKLRAANDARHRDRVLITSYVSVEQIEQTRDQHLYLIEGQVRVTSQYLETLEGRLKELQTQALFFRPYSSNGSAERMPDNLAEDLVLTVRDIRTQQRNLASKRRRGMRRLEASSSVQAGPEPIGPDSDPEALMLEAERRRRWRLVLHAMPDRDRRCLLLRAEGLRYRDIAVALGVSLGSVAKSIARGIARLVSADQV